MANALPKWTDDRTEQLTNAVGQDSPVTLVKVAELAEQLETTTRSVASKLRKMGYEVELASAKASKFSVEQAEALAEFVEGNSGEFTYAEIAAGFDGGVFSAKQIQGKILSMELTAHVKATPKVEVERKYTKAEEDKFIELANGGAFLEDIAEALDKPLNSVRGKALSFLRSEEIAAIPKQKNSNAKETVDGLTALGDVSGMTVEEIATALEKTPRGVRTMLTRRGLVAADYDGASKKAKNEAA